MNLINKHLLFALFAGVTLSLVNKSTSCTVANAAVCMTAANSGTSSLSIDIEALLRQSFDKAKNFAELAEDVVRKVMANKSQFMAQHNLTEEFFNEFVKALESVKKAHDEAKVQKALRPYSHLLLPAKATVQEMLAYRSKIRNLLYANKARRK